ncbi:MAG: sigma-70 family RNA polymerase sigma factor [Armatimonadia bacterium]|nr:sigma-70 family RNA polymerase sigma factor [Armatimonadia bacterium]
MGQMLRILRGRARAVFEGGSRVAAQIGLRAWDRLPDEYVVELCKREDDPDALEHLLRKYRSVVLFKSRSYFLQGADRDDMIQEGMVGLYKAIRDFRPDRACSFRTFADVCITRQMITAVKSGVGQRQLAVVYSHALRGNYRDEATGDPLEAAPDSDQQDPEKLLITKETVRNLRAALKESLSPFEWNVFVGFSDGKSYQQIAEENDCTPKSVDNALCRVRRKVQRYDVEEGMVS